MRKVKLDGYTFSKLSGMVYHKGESGKFVNDTFYSTATFAGRTLGELAEQGVYIKSFAFKLDNGQYLSFNAFFDFCEVYLLDKDMNIITVPRNTICSMIHNG